MLRRREEAEEVTQEAFLKAFTSLSSLRDPEALHAWLGRITSTLCLTRLRSPRYQREVTVAEITPPDAGLAEDLEFACQVRAAVAQLTPIYRLAIVSFYLEGRSYNEAARVAGVGVRTLKTRLYRARLELRALLAEALERTP